MVHPGICPAALLVWALWQMRVFGIMSTEMIVYFSCDLLCLSFCSWNKRIRSRCPSPSSWFILFFILIAMFAASPRSSACRQRKSVSRWTLGWALQPLLWCSCRNPTGPGTTPVEQPVPLFREAANPVHTWGHGSQEALLPLATPLWIEDNLINGGPARGSRRCQYFANSCSGEGSGTKSDPTDWGSIRFHSCY